MKRPDVPLKKWSAEWKLILQSRIHFLYWIIWKLSERTGRLSTVKAFVASALKIKPVMGATPEGTICQLDQARGINKALIKMVQYIVEKTKDSEKKILAISHCNCYDRAMILKKALEEKMAVKRIVVLDTAGVSSACTPMTAE